MGTIGAVASSLERTWLFTWFLSLVVFIQSIISIGGTGSRCGASGNKAA